MRPVEGRKERSGGSAGPRTREPAQRAALLLASLAVAACGDPTTVLDPDPIPGPGDHVRTLLSGGRERTYRVHVPASVDVARPAPVVLVFHGVPRTEGGMARLTGFDPVADDHGLVVVYPEAAPFIGDWGVGCDLCTRARREGVDDVRFTRDLLDQLADELVVDPARVFAVGYSQGGLMAFRLACDLASRLQAFATVGALMVQSEARSCRPGQPLDALLIHGTADPEFLWEGSGEGLEVSLSAAATLDFWESAYRCGAGVSTEALPDVADDGTTVTREVHGPCAEGTAVEFYTVHGGGHPWPGAPVQFGPSLGPKSEDLDASTVIGAFLAGL